MWTIEQQRISARKSYYKHHEKRQKAIKLWFKNHPEKRKEYCRRDREKRKRLALEAYGGPICIICGEQDLKKLSLDHQNGDGKQFRESFRKNYRCMAGDHFYRWLKKQGYPKNLGLRVLCLKCNYVEGMRAKKSA